MEQADLFHLLAIPSSERDKRDDPHPGSSLDPHSDSARETIDCVVKGGCDGAVEHEAATVHVTLDVGSVDNTSINPPSEIDDACALSCVSPRHAADFESFKAAPSETELRTSFIGLQHKPAGKDLETEVSPNTEGALTGFAETGGEDFLETAPTFADGSTGVSGGTVSDTDRQPHGEKMINDVDLDNASADGTENPKPPRRGRKPIYDELPPAFATALHDGPVKDIPRDPYFRMVNDSVQGDRHPLRTLWRLAEFEKKNIANLTLTEDAITKLLVKHRLARNPKRFAGQILICFGRLVERYPDILTIQCESIVDTRVHPLPANRVPAAIHRNLSTWVGLVPVKVDDSPNIKGALTADTIETYVRNVHTILAGLSLSGVRLDPTVDIAFLIQRAAVTRWLKFLKKTMAASTMQGLVASLLRIARDLPSQSATDIEFLQARLQNLMVHPALDADAMSRLASWVEPRRHHCLLSAPDELMRAAEDDRALPSQRMLGSAAAFGFILMWEHPGLTESAIADFDLAVHIVGEPGNRQALRFREARGRQPSGWVEEPLTREAESIFDRLSAVRASMSLTTTLLLPGVDGRPRRVSSAMEVLYTKIQGVLSERLVLSDFKDLNGYIALNGKNADLSEIADGLNYKDVRSLERRFGEHARRVAAADEGSR